jgi:hypothetical protein
MLAIQHNDRGTSGVGAAQLPISRASRKQQQRSNPFRFPLQEHLQACRKVQTMTSLINSPMLRQQNLPVGPGPRELCIAQVATVGSTSRPLRRGLVQPDLSGAAPWGSVKDKLEQTPSDLSAASPWSLLPAREKLILGCASSFLISNLVSGCPRCKERLEVKQGHSRAD